jgi:ATPase subunit of ABC transporter with duplicated ATPase domains
LILTFISKQQAETKNKTKQNKTKTKQKQKKAKTKESKTKQRPKQSSAKIAIDSIFRTPEMDRIKVIEKKGIRIEIAFSNGHSSGKNVLEIHPRRLNMGKGRIERVRISFPLNFSALRD